MLIRSSAQNIKPINDGIPINKTNFWPFLIVLLNVVLSLITSNLDKVGSNTVPIAIAKIPNGNWTNLSDTYNHVGLPVSNNDANIVSTNKLICIIPPAKIAGKITTKNFLIPLLLKFIFGVGSLLMLLKGAIWITNWSKPASKTLHARTYMGISYFGAINSAATISDKLKITGVKAGKENFWCVFWIPPAKATNDIKAKYGNIILKTWTEISCFIGSK